jgi:hypothetical protein
VCRKIIRHNFRIWETENPFEFNNHMCDSRKVNLKCGEMKKKVGLSIFKEVDEKYLAVMENCFASHSCRNNFPVRWCTTSVLQSCYFRSGQRTHWTLNGKRGLVSWHPCSSDLTQASSLKTRCKIWISCLKVVLELQCPPVLGEKLNIALKCALPLTVAILSFFLLLLLLLLLLVLLLLFILQMGFYPVAVVLQ